MDISGVVELRLAGYAPATDFALNVVEGARTTLNAKLFSEQYLQAVKRANEAFHVGHLTDANKFITIALGLEPNDTQAVRLRDEILRRAEQAQPRILRKLDSFLLAEALRDYAGREIVLEYRLSSVECLTFSSQLQEALQSAGLIVAKSALADNDVCFDVEIIKSRSSALEPMATALFDALTGRGIAARMASGRDSLNAITVRVGEKSY